MFVKYFYYLCRVLNKEAMEKNKEKAMPKSIIIASEREYIGNRIRSELRRAQDAYTILRTGKDPNADFVVARSFKGVEDLGEIPMPDKVTESWLVAVVDRKREAINASDILTVDEKKSRIGHLATTEKKARPIVQTVEKFIKTIPAALYRYDDDVKNFYIGGLGEYIDELATREVPEEAADHWQLIQEARAAIDRLRGFEKEHLRIKNPLEVILRSSVETIAEQWATDSNRRLIEYENNPRMYEIRTSTYL